MGKKKTKHETEAVSEGEPVLTIPIQAAPDETFTVNGVTVEAATVGRWGYGYERTGNKWRAYRTGTELTYLTPRRGEELHHAVARIMGALKLEINKSARTRGKKVA